VDIIISEPLGNMLFNERMLESFLIARDRFLKKDGIMFPTYVKFFAAPFFDEKLYQETIAKVENFWKNKQFFGIDLSILKDKAILQKLRQPVINAYSDEMNLAKGEFQIVDFRTIKVEELNALSYEFHLRTTKVGVLDGIGFWFDAIFKGTAEEVVLSTSPSAKTTHWYQIRLLIKDRIGINPGQDINISMKMESNKWQSYSISLKVELPILNITSQFKKYDLKDPVY